MRKIKYIINFNNVEATNAELVGNKGANLTKLFKNHLNVPKTYFIINKYFTTNNFVLNEDFLKPIITNLEKPWFIRSSCKEG